MSEVKVGVGAIIIRDGKTYLCRRKSQHGTGYYGSMGGHMEFGETPEEAIIREAKEELNITIKNLKYLCTTSFTLNGKHYIDIGFLAQDFLGEPMNNEPEKFDDTGWFKISAMPDKLLPPLKKYFECLDNPGQLFVDHKN